MKGIRTSTALVLLLVAASATGFFAPASSAAARTPVPDGLVSSRKLATGVVFQQIHLSVGPERVYVLRFTPARAAGTIDLATAGPTIGTYARTSQIGSDNGAIAAVNGDFTIDPGKPLHPFMNDGSLRSSGWQTGVSFALSKDKTREYIDNEHVVVGGADLRSGTRFGVADWNQAPPGRNDVVGYTPYGGSGERPPGNACSVLLAPAAKLAWGPLQVGLRRDYAVQAVRCGSTAMAVQKKTVVLSSRTSGPGSTILRSLKKGDTVRLHWSYGWTDVMDSVGGMPLLVQNGTVIPHTCSSYFCSRNPRTAIGYTSTGQLVFTVVDGREQGSAGMTLVEIAKEMKALGCVWAMNLDGGGGSTMWIKGLGVVNHPSDWTGERPVTQAVLILPGADASEPTPTLASVVGPGVISGPDARAVQSLADTDPGSTGGLLDAVGVGAFGPTPLPPRLLGVVRDFRASLASP